MSKETEKTDREPPIERIHGWAIDLIKHEDWDGWFVVCYDTNDRCLYMTPDFDYPGDAIDHARNWMKESVVRSNTKGPSLETS